MLPIEYEFRWQHVWRLLSLDDAMPFFEEMWVPCEPEPLSNGLRSVLRQWENDSEFFLCNPSIVSYQCFRWFEANIGATRLPVLIRWADSIYSGPGGSGRYAERWWNMVPLDALRDPARKELFSPWIIDFIHNVQSKKMEFWPGVEDKFESQFHTPVTDWDRAAQKMQDTDREADQNKIRLIVSLNAFALAWEKETAALSTEQMDELYHLGNRLASKRQTELGGVAYPGSWRFFLLPFLQNAPAAWKQ